jgi:hypothetical protein
MFSPLPDFKWKNWLGNQTCEATLYSPESLDDLCQCMRDTCGGKSVRTVGESYAWSALVPTPQSLIGMSKLNKVLGIDREKNTILIEAGMKVTDLAQTAAQNGMTLRSPPIFAQMSVGGALAVGAHGTGQRWASMSDDILELTMVLPDGTSRTLTAADGDLFHSAIVGLGAFGIIYSIRLQCEPEFHVRMEKGFLPKIDVCRSLDDLLNTYEFVELYWFLTTDTVWVVRMNRVDAPVDQVSLFDQARQKLRDQAINVIGNAVFPMIARTFPKQMVELLQFIYTVIPPVMTGPPAPGRLMAAPPPRRMGPGPAIRRSRTIASILNNAINLYSNQVQTASQAFHYIGRYLKSWDSEFSIPIEDAADGWQKIQTMVQGYMERGQFPMNLAMHARFVNVSNAFLAQSFGRKSCLLEVVTLEGTPGADLFLSEFHDAMMTYPDGRPHWGKVFTDDDAHLAQICKSYPAMDKFMAARKGIDPEDVYLNQFLQRLCEITGAKSV